MVNEISLYRKNIVDLIIPYAKKDKRIYLLVCDMGFGVADKFKAELPDRIFNVGMMEQGAVSIAAGMAMTGLIPIVYSIVNFLAFRSLEQVRNDVVRQELNVKFIATGVNDYFTNLGYSHCCGEDDKRLMELVGLKVFDPYVNKPANFKRLVRQWLADKKPGYMRV